MSGTPQRARCQAHLAAATRCALGEGPTWDARRGRLLWLDVDGRRLHTLTPTDGTGTATASIASIEMAARCSVVVPTAGGGLLAVSGTSVVELHPDGTLGRTVAELPPDGDGLANDGRVDPWGRLWVGTVDRSGAHAGGVFVVGADGEVTRVLTGIALSNGLDWSPDATACYYVDSLTHRVDVVDLDADGLPCGRRPLAHTTGLPDGVTVDADGGVWVALWDGGGVHRYTPDGLLDRVVDVPAGYVTSCAFGGADLETLYITTAIHDITAGHPRAGDDRGGRAGDLFAADVGIGGLGYTEFGAAAFGDTRVGGRLRRTPGRTHSTD